eukprot:7844842-Prorocentrum_lima.AAC.1
MKRAYTADILKGKQVWIKGQQPGKGGSRLCHYRRGKIPTTESPRSRTARRTKANLSGIAR